MLCSVYRLQLQHGKTKRKPQARRQGRTAPDNDHHFVFPYLVPLRCRDCRRSRRSGGGGAPRREGRCRGRRWNRRRGSGRGWEEIVDGKKARGHAEEGDAQPAQPSHLQVGGGYDNIPAEKPCFVGARSDVLRSCLGVVCPPSEWGKLSWEWTVWVMYWLEGVWRVCFLCMVWRLLVLEGVWDWF